MTQSELNTPSRRPSPTAWAMTSPTEKSRPPQAPAPTTRPHTPTTPQNTFAWAVRAGLLIISHTPSALAQLTPRPAAAPPTLTPRPTDDAPTLTPGAADDAPTLTLHPAALSAFASPRWLASRRLPWLSPLMNRLDPTHRVTATLDVTSEALALHTNVGLWELLAALLSADRDQLDALTSGLLPVRCRELLTTFCATYPNASPCDPAALGRIPAARSICNQLNL